MAVRIRMKRMGRKHRPFFRICAVDARNPRDGRVLEELGTYDPMIPDTDARVVLKSERLSYWLSQGAQPSDKVRVFIKKYGEQGTHADARRAARERLAQPKQVPPPPEPVYVSQPRAAAQPAVETGEVQASDGAAETDGMDETAHVVEETAARAAAE